MDSLRPGLSGVDVDTSFFRPASYIEAVGRQPSLGADHRPRAARARRWRRCCSTCAGCSSRCSPCSSRWRPRSLVLYLRGETLNAMVLAGLVLALVVSSTTRSGVERRTGRGDSATAPRSRARGAGPLVYGTVIALLVLVPILVLARRDGRVPAAARRSPTPARWSPRMLVALTVTPALGMLAAREGSREPSPPVAGSARAAATTRSCPGSPSRVPAGLIAVGVLLVARARAGCRSSTGATRSCPTSRTATC